MKLDRPKFETFKDGDFPSPGGVYDVFEPKMDGWWGQNLIVGNKWEIWSRAGLLKKDGCLEAAGDVPRTLIHGEFCYGTEWSKDRPKFYGRIAVFGAEMIAGEDVRRLSNSKVRTDISMFLRAMGSEPIAKRCFMVPQYPIAEAPKFWEEQVLAGEQFEGLVFRNSEADWSGTLGRMKRTLSIEYVCMGFNESDSDTYAGWGVACVLGGLYVNGELVRRCKVSGLTDERRAEFFKNPDKYIGKVFEADGKKLSKKGSLRHPNFLRWRPDKPVEDCIWER